jgi:hypothetical protein
LKSSTIAPSSPTGRYAAYSSWKASSSAVPVGCHGAGPAVSVSASASP